MLCTLFFCLCDKNLSKKSQNFISVDFGGYLLLLQHIFLQPIFHTGLKVVTTCHRLGRGGNLSKIPACNPGGHPLPLTGILSKKKTFALSICLPIEQLLLTPKGGGHFQSSKNHSITFFSPENQSVTTLPGGSATVEYKGK